MENKLILFFFLGDLLWSIVGAKSRINEVDVICDRMSFNFLLILFNNVLVFYGASCK
jgi:hypothetical protein